jgi:carboxymethylenebutenolidase
VLPAYRAAPAAPPRGQLVVLHEFFGLNDHIRNVADRFAALGYGAVVPGLSDRAEPGAEFGYDPSGIAAGHALRAKIPIEDSLLDAQAAIDFVKPFGKVGVVGYCWGGSLAFFSAARLRDLTCAVGYYGSQIVARAHEVPKVPTIAAFRRHRCQHPAQRCREDPASAAGRLDPCLPRPARFQLRRALQL